MDLKGKTVLVTGASSGIGRAVAIACAQKGAIVLIHYRKNRKGAQEVLSEVEKYSRGKILAADLADPKQIEGMFKSIEHIDLLVNNAGDARPGDFFDDEMCEFEFRNVFFPTLRVSQSFDWDVLIPQYVNLYKTLIDTYQLDKQFKPWSPLTRMLQSELK